MNETKNPQTQTSGESLALMPIKDLLIQSWNFYQKNWKKFVLLLLIPFAVMIVFYLVLIAGLMGGLLLQVLTKGMSGLLLLIPLVVLLAYIVMLIIGAWVLLAMINIFKNEKLTVKEAFSISVPKLGSAVLVCIILSIGLAIGYALFIIPGIIFTIWYCLVFYVLVFENTGVGGAFKSRELVKGFGWSVFFRIIALVAISFLVSLVCVFIPIIGRIISLVLNFIILPIWVIYLGFVYKDLTRIKTKNPKAIERVPAWQKILATALVAIFFLLMCIIPLIFAAIFALSNLKNVSKTPGLPSFELKNLGTNQPVDLFGPLTPSFENINFDQGEDFEKFMKDTDKDNLPDSMEEIFKTDPNKSDSDGDGVLDGDEISKGTDPLDSKSK